MIERELEPEVMDDPAESRSYDAMDHSAVNAKFVEDLLQLGDVEGDVLDLGTGTAQIPILLCHRAPNCRVMACDAAVSMLEIGRVNVAVEGLEHRFQFHLDDAKSLVFQDEMFDYVLSNSVIHHVPEPAEAISEMVRVVRVGGRLFVRDLLRPPTHDEVERLVALHASSEPPENQQLLRQSLIAALTLDEVRDMVKVHGFAAESVQVTSDRHWTWTAVRET